MLDQLPFGSFVPRSSFGKNRFHPDLARFSLDLSRASVGPLRHSPVGSYPSPPMSGSPPVSESDLSPEDRRSHDVPRPVSQEEHQEREGTSSDVRRRTPPWEIQRNPEWTPIEPATTSARTVETQTLGYHQILPPATRPNRTEHSTTVSTSALTPGLRAHTPPSTRTPRRTKAHVASACINCRKAHLACDVQRPCGRCVTTGKEDTCRDVQHKKRGRPRIKDDRSTKYGTVSHSYRTQAQRMAAPSVGSPHPLLSVPPPLVAGGYRTLRAQPGEVGRGRGRRSGYGSPVPPMSALTTSSPLGGSEYPVRGPRLGRGTATAYLRMNFDVVRASPALSHTLRYSVAELERTNLVHLVDSQDLSTVNWIQHEMRREQEIREHGYMPPSYEGGELEAIRHVQEADVPELVQGAPERTAEMTFRLGDGQPSRILVRFALVRTSVYFVMLSFDLEGPSVQHFPERPFTFTSQDYPRPSFPFTGYGPPTQSPSSSQHVHGGSVFGSLTGPAMPQYPPRDFPPTVGPPSVHQSPATSQQSLGGHVVERRPFAGTSPPAAALSSLQSPVSPAAGGRVTETYERARAPRLEYPPELQLPPIRSQPEPEQVREEQGRRRAQEEREQEDDEADSGRRRKRPRVSVKSMLE